jgi:hypothetical protein
MRGRVRSRKALSQLRQVVTVCCIGPSGRSGAISVYSQAKPSQSSVGGELREALVDVPLSVSHSCVDRIAGLNNPLTTELNLSSQRCLTRFLTGILLLEPCLSLIHA